MEFEISVARRVADIGREAWDHVAGDLPFASFRWQQFAEAVRREDQPCYVTLSRGGEPRARAIFWQTYMEPVPLDSPIARGAAQAIMRLRPPLLCQRPFACLPGLILPPEEPERTAALQAIARAACDIARRRGAPFVTFSYLDRATAHRPDWPAAALPPFDGDDAGTALAVAWTSFDEYLMRALSHRTRRTYHQHLRKAEAAGIEIECSPHVTGIAAALPLIRAVQKKYGAPLHPWVPRQLAHAHLVDSAWITARRSGELIGCELLLGDRGVWYNLALGRRYDVEDTYYLLQYANLRWAIEHGARAVRWGSTLYEFKAHYGFEQEDNTGLVAIPVGPAWWVNATRGLARRIMGAV